MNIAMILSGGTGTRLGGDIPKQYIEVKSRMIIEYALQPFLENDYIDKIIVVISEDWIKALCASGIKQNEKFMCYAKAGDSRQKSIYNGLSEAFEHGACDDDVTIIHDAARPNISSKLISDCIKPLLDNYEIDGVMPVIPVKDTMYQSRDGHTISSLLNRDEIYAGQAPEAFRFGKYYSLHRNLSKKELAEIRGSTVIAYQNGMKIKLIPGDEHNYKITTMNDLEKFKSEVLGVKP